MIIARKATHCLRLYHVTDMLVNRLMLSCLGAHRAGEVIWQGAGNEEAEERGDAAQGAGEECGGKEGKCGGGGEGGDGSMCVRVG